MADSLQQIIDQLQTSTYAPQVQSIQQQQADLPGQVANEEQGLQAKQSTAFGDILNQARARGTGVAFGGIPLQEQAKYTADTYLPALANLHTAQKQQATSLQDAINKIYENRNTQAQGIYQFQQQQDATAASLAEQKREFDAQQATARAAAAASPYNPSLGGSGSPTTPKASDAPAAAKTDPVAQAAYTFIQTKASQGTAALISDFKAALDYYNKTGNQPDFVKLSIYKQKYPDLFGSVQVTPYGQINTATQKATF